MMFADMIRTDLIAARMRTCIPYNICKWASSYLLAIFFFFFFSFVPVPLVLWKHCHDRCPVPPVCRRTRVLPLLEGPVGAGPYSSRVDSCCSFYFCCSTLRGSAPQPPFSEPACELAFLHQGSPPFPAVGPVWAPSLGRRSSPPSCRGAGLPPELRSPGTAGSQPSTPRVASGLAGCLG